LDLSNISNDEEFFVYKNRASNTYEVFTWTTNIDYRYIDKFWNNVDIEDFTWNIYERTFKKVVNMWDNDGTNVEFESVEIDIKKFEK
jgi:hypothetical protein